MPAQLALTNTSLCCAQVARPDSLSRLGWAVGALAAPATDDLPRRFPTPQQELQAALLARLCAHFAAGGAAEAAAAPASASSLAALSEQVGDAMPGLFVPLAESVSEALASKRGGPKHADLRGRVQQFGDALGFFVLHPPPGALAPAPKGSTAQCLDHLARPLQLYWR